MINLDAFANDLTKDVDLEQISVMQLVASMSSNFEIALDYGIIVPENVAFDFTKCRAFLARHGKYSCFIEEGKEAVEAISFGNYIDDNEIVFRKGLNGFEPNYTKSKPITNPVLLEIKKFALVKNG